MIIKTKNYQTSTTHQLSTQLMALGLSNLFNPSIAFLDRLTVVAFRAIDKSSKSQNIEAFVALFTESNTCLDLFSLSEYAYQRGIAKAADPKLFKRKHDGSVWLTFNTGYVQSGNELYVMQIYPHLEEPRRCLLPTRMKIEKNWAFFFDGDQLNAYYSISPLKIIGGESLIGNSKTITFREIYSSDEHSLAAPLSIGTQAVELPNGHGLIGHRKIHMFGKRLYYGVPVGIRNVDGKYMTERSNRQLIHNYTSLLGSRDKHNKNLISCTYFSGLDFVGDQIVLGYGINDVSFGLAMLNPIQLWK